MTNSDLPKRDIEDHFYCARYIPPSKYEDGIVSAAAFALRIKEEYLSVNCPDVTGKRGIANQMNELSQIYIHQKKLKPSKTAVFALFNVGNTKVHVKEVANVELEFEHIPECDDYTHTGIWGSEPEVDELVSELIKECVGHIFPVYPPAGS